MFDIKKVITAKRTDSSQFLITYQAGQDILTLIVSREINGWTSRFHVLIKGTTGTTEPDFLYHDNEPTDQDKAFWRDLGDLAFHLKDEAYTARQKHIRKVLN